MRIFGVCSYRGSKYQGWQKQPFFPTIEEEIEKVLSQYFHCDINIYGSGRTDAGVHALGQTFHFDISNRDVDLDRLLYSINKMLPDDICILSFDQVDDDFHARYSAKKKQYLYMIEVNTKDPFVYEIVDLEKEEFDIDVFEKCLSLFVGEHNFQNFTSKENDEQGFVRNIESIEVKKDGLALTISLIGNGFMRYMIRYIIGTSLACSKNKITIEEVNDLINCRNKERNIVSYKASPNGLYLNKVFY